MATQVQWRGGSTAEHATFTGAAREVTVDTQKQTLVLHDGSTAGGRPLLREDGSNAALALGSAGTPSLKFTGDPNTGIYSPGADQVAISTNGTGRLFVDASGNVGLNTSAPGFFFDVNTGAANEVAAGFRTSATGAAISFRDSTTTSTARPQVGAIGNDLVVKTGNTPQERMRLTAAGLLGLGTSSPGELLDVAGNIRQTGNTAGTANTVGLIDFYNANNTTTIARINVRTDGAANNGSYRISTANAGTLNEVVRIDSSGRVGIGTTSPSSKLVVEDSSALKIAVLRTGTAVVGMGVESGPYVYSDGALQFRVGATAGGSADERARIDTSGRLLVGTSTARSNFFNSTNSARFQIEGNGSNENYALSIVSNFAGGTNGAQVLLAKSGGASVGSTALVSDGNTIGVISFQGADGTEFVPAASISGEVDGTPGANDMPGRLMFSTTADGAASPTERMRITSGGDIHTAGRTSASLSTTGCTLEANGAIWAVRSGGTVGVVNRRTDDGNLIEFYQADTLEGAISVSGTTVTYGGGHLARWSQLPNEEDPSDLLKGTVMSNLDEMCEWGEEDNEQLNKTKVSDVEGDPNVAGVFVSTSISDDGPLDFFVAMTGDMIIRIAEGVTVERGDLLMSAGDGTAKPQDDDIIRSKTVAKVTSTNVSCTYEDGSYCVPCVLMAC